MECIRRSGADFRGFPFFCFHIYDFVPRLGIELALLGGQKPKYGNKMPIKGTGKSPEFYPPPPYAPNPTPQIGGCTLLFNIYFILIRNPGYFLSNCTACFGAKNNSKAYIFEKEGLSERPRLKKLNLWEQPRQKIGGFPAAHTHTVLIWEYIPHHPQEYNKYYNHLLLNAEQLLRRVLFKWKHISACRHSGKLFKTCELNKMRTLSHVKRKIVFSVYDQVRLKPACSATGAS